MSENRWVKLTIRSNGGIDSVYKLMGSAYWSDEEEMREYAREWASDTHIGQCADHYTFSWEVVDALPREVAAGMRSDAEDSIAHHQAILHALDGTTLVDQCRQHSCQNAATKRARLLKELGCVYQGDSVYDDNESPVCDGCFEANEASGRSWEKRRAVREAKQKLEEK